MNRIESTLSRLETNIRSMVEGDAARGGLPRKMYNPLVHSLGNAMQAGKQNLLESDGTVGVYAPDKYTLIMPEEQARIVIAHPAAIDRLCQKIVSMAVHEKISLPASPIIRVVPDPEISQPIVQAEFSQVDLDDSLTTELDQLNGSAKQNANRMIPSAFLIVNGLTTYQLSQAVINIGRDSSNQLVLDDPRISRLHAQLRLILERFVIFDLDSKGGTFVNGVPVSSHALNPGDVIMLAGVPLVYGQDQSSRAGFTQELEAFPQHPEVL